MKNLKKKKPDRERRAGSLREQAAGAMEDCLAGLPFQASQIECGDLSNENNPPDLLVCVQAPAGTILLAAEISGDGQPRYARQAVNQLHRYLDRGQASYGVFIAPFITPASATTCIEEGMGYLDLAGNCRLSFGTIYIEKTGNPNPFARRRDLRSLYSPKAERILRVLMHDVRKPWKTEDLAREAQVSLGQVANVRKLLRDREWIAEDRETGFRISQPEKLLEEWAASYDFDRNDARELYSLLDLATLEEKVEQACSSLGLEFAFTGFGAAARLAPMVRYQKVTIYVSGIPGELFEKLQAHEVPSGANLTLLVPYDDGVFYGKKEVEKTPLVSPVQLYLDLSSSAGRGREAAEALKERIIRTSWP